MLSLHIKKAILFFLKKMWDCNLVLLTISFLHFTDWLQFWPQNSVVSKASSGTKQYLSLLWHKHRERFLRSPGQLSWKFYQLQVVVKDCWGPAHPGHRSHTVQSSPSLLSNVELPCPQATLQFEVFFLFQDPSRSLFLHCNSYPKLPFSISTHSAWDLFLFLHLANVLAVGDQSRIHQAGQAINVIEDFMV